MKKQTHIKIALTACITAATAAVILCACISEGGSQNTQSVYSRMPYTRPERSSAPRSSEEESLEESSEESSEISSEASSDTSSAEQSSTLIYTEPSSAQTSSTEELSPSSAASSHAPSPSSKAPSASSKAPTPPVPQSPPPAPAASAPITNTNNDYSATGNVDVENAIIDKVNALRASLGLDPYIKNNDLMNVSYIRSKEMYDNKYFEHTRPDGSSYSSAFDEGGYKWSLISENIGHSTGYSIDSLADVLFNGWKNSKSHYEAMINKEFKEIGVSVYTDGNETYATQSFGVPE